MSEHPYNQPIGDRSIVACPYCDIVQQIGEVALGGSARCAQCGQVLWRNRTDSLSRTFALSIAAAILYLVANFTPMLGLTIVGRSASTTVFGGAKHLWDDGRTAVALLVLFTAVVAPAVQIGCALLISGSALRARAPAWV